MDENQVSHRSGPSWIRSVATVAAFMMTTVLLVLIGRAAITWKKPCPDYLCFWATGRILVSGGSPYDFELQAQVQKELGWDKETDGLGFYDFLPYYYPPSVLAPVCVALLPLGYPTARIAWLVINAELLFVIGWLLRDALKGVARWIPMVVVPIFGLSILSVLVGQLTALVMFLIVVTWRLLQARWDRSAGWVLAWMSIKPQLTLVLLVAMLLWSIRQRRWQVLEGFFTGLVLLLGLTTWLIPSWPVQLASAIINTPVVTATHPCIGTTWFLVLRSIGASGWLLWAGYVAVALPVAFLLLRTVMDRTAPPHDVLALSLLAAFFIAPHGRIYDLPVLIVPLLVLIAGRLEQLWTAGLLFVFVVLPYVHFIYWLPPATFPLHVTFFWVPLLLVLFWLATRTSTPRASA